MEFLEEREGQEIISEILGEFFDAESGDDFSKDSYEAEGQKEPEHGSQREALQMKGLPIASQSLALMAALLPGPEDDFDFPAAVGDGSRL